MTLLIPDAHPVAGAGADVLEGTLTSTWLLPPDCMHTCTVQFAIEARHGSR